MAPHHVLHQFLILLGKPTVVTDVDSQVYTDTRRHTCACNWQFQAALDYRFSHKNLPAYSEEGKKYSKEFHRNFIPLNCLPVISVEPLYFYPWHRCTLLTDFYYAHSTQCNNINRFTTGHTGSCTPAYRHRQAVGTRTLTGTYNTHTYGGAWVT